MIKKRRYDSYKGIQKRKKKKNQVRMHTMYGESLKKLVIKPPYDPAIPLLGIYSEETKI